MMAFGQRSRHGIKRRERGNVLLALFATVAVVGALGAAYVGYIKGPVSTMQKSNKAQISLTSMAAAARLVGKTAGPLDCDADGIIEPMAWDAPGAGIPVPTGGGLLPAAAGAAKADPWGMKYGYCVWDHGTKTKADNVAACGGTAARRLTGGNVADLPIIAIISAGADRRFQTTCNNFADSNADGKPDTPLVVKTPGSDDIILTAAKDQILASSSDTAKLEYQPDEACNSGALGLMRMDMGLVQICTETGWREVGASVDTSNNFIARTGANLSTVYTSNAISFVGYYGARPVTASAGATLVVNGVDRGSTYNVKSSDLVSLRATSSSTMNVTLSFSATMKAAPADIVRPWTIRTEITCYNGPLGTLCPDGESVYAGTTVGGERFFVATANQPSNFAHKTTNTFTANTNSTSDGKLNTAGMLASGLALHPAAQSCRNRGEEWYLPAIDEMTTIYNNRGSLSAYNIGNPSNYYWSSTQHPTSTTVAYMRYLNSTPNTTTSKTSAYPIRCARREGTVEAPTCQTGDVGTPCTDGTTYVGNTVDGDRMYMANTNESTSLAHKTANTATTGTEGTSDGKANTAAMKAAGIALHPAANSCANRGESWYLPALDELTTVYSNNASLASMSFTGNYYWSSSQHATSQTVGLMRYLTSTSSTNTSKTSAYPIRCARRDGEIVSNRTYDCTSPNISTSEYHSCAIRDNGTVACWGHGGSYTATTPPAGTFSEIAVSMYANSSSYPNSCGLKTDGTLACWGYIFAGYGAPPAGTFKAISLSDAPHLCAIKTDDTLACYGYAGSYAATTPPTGTFVDVKTSGATSNGYACGIRTDGTLACWGYLSSIGYPPPSGTFKKIALSDHHGCAIRTNDTVACWGYGGSYSATTPPAGTFSAIATSVYANSSSYTNSCGIKTDGTLACWGYIQAGYGAPPTGSFKAISLSDAPHACALRSDNTVTCWGSAGSYSSTSMPAGSYISIVTGGYSSVSSSCGMKLDGTIGCAGYTSATTGYTPPTGAFKLPICTGSAVVGGYTWYLGNTGQSCDAVCADYGGCNATGLLWASGSANVHKCNSVLSGVGAGAAPTTGIGSGTGLGCFVENNVQRGFDTNASCTASSANARRACACN